MSVLSSSSPPPPPRQSADTKPPDRAPTELRGVRVVMVCLVAFFFAFLAKAEPQKVFVSPLSTGSLRLGWGFELLHRTGKLRTGRKSALTHALFPACDGRMGCEIYGLPSDVTLPASLVSPSRSGRIGEEEARHDIRCSPHFRCCAAGKSKRCIVLPYQVASFCRQCSVFAWYFTFRFFEGKGKWEQGSFGASSSLVCCPHPARG